MTTIRKLHSQWAARCVPASAPQIQRQEMERAFYSGALAFLQLQIGEVAALPDAQAERVLKQLHEELTDYFRTLATLPPKPGGQ